jgi:hypothetical protein
MIMQEPILAPVSAGELVDKITILRIKFARLVDAAKRQHVSRELGLLEAIAERSLAERSQIETLVTDLKDVNARLWEVEDDIRGCEACGDFGQSFVELARSVYRLNDMRAEIKRQINERVGSRIVEAKQYRPYG